uniref:Cytochrome b561 domain-containing protein n=1 Tax=Schistosoma mansoni TaxID=6183 RepID=A0A3Q0KBI4_SCHMA
MKHKLAIHPNHSNNRRKHPKRCTLIVYHISLGLLFIGIILTIIGLTTKRLFHIYIYDHRNPAKFHHVHIPVGLFSLNTYVTWLSMEKSILDQNLEISDLRWTLARIMSLIGLLTAITSFIIHIILAHFRTNRKWSNVLAEVVFLLIAVACILIGLSLAETEIEYIHDHGDMILTKVLLSNGLIETNNQYSNQFYLDSTVGSLNLEGTNGLSSRSTSSSISSISSSSSSSTDNDRLGLTGEFALYLTPPLSSFFLLISADFIYLLSFLAVLIYFVRLCEKAVADRKQMKCAETTNRV